MIAIVTGWAEALMEIFVFDIHRLPDMSGRAERPYTYPSYMYVHVNLCIISICLDVYLIFCCICVSQCLRHPRLGRASADV